MEQEIWKPIKGFEGFYEISNFGRVKSLERTYKTRNNKTWHVGEKFLKIVPLNGYPAVVLSKNSVCRRYTIHRLIAEAFIPNPENKPHIDHINTDKTDFRISNLRWVTPKENANNPLTLQHCRENTHTDERNRKINAKKKELGILIEVFQYTKDGVFVAHYESIHQAQIATGIYASQIRLVLDDNTQSAGGFMWFTKKHDNLEYKRRLSKNAKIVIEIDGSGKEIKRWNMLKDAAKEIGVTRDNVRKAIKENRKVKGHMMQYGSIIK